MSETNALVLRKDVVENMTIEHEAGAVEGLFFVAKENPVNRRWNKERLNAMFRIPTLTSFGVYAAVATPGIITGEIFFTTIGLAGFLIANPIVTHFTGRAYRAKRDQYDRIVAPQVQRWLAHEYKITVDKDTLLKIVRIVADPFTPESMKNQKGVEAKLIFQDINGREFTLLKDENSKSYVDYTPDVVLEDSIKTITALSLPSGSPEDSLFLNQIKTPFDRKSVEGKAFVNGQADKVQAWLITNYKVNVSRKVAKRIVSGMMHFNSVSTLQGSDAERHLKFEDVNNKSYLMQKVANNSWTITARKQSDFGEYQNFELETQSFSADDTEGESTAVIENLVKGLTQKISMLKTQELTPEDNYVISRAQAESHEAIQLASQLQKLGDPTYLNELEESITLIDKDVEKVLNRQLSSVKAKILEQREYITSRNPAKTSPIMLKKSEDYDDEEDNL